MCFKFDFEKFVFPEVSGIKDFKLNAMTTVKINVFKQTILIKILSFIIIGMMIKTRVSILRNSSTLVSSNFPGLLYSQGLECQRCRRRNLCFGVAKRARTTC